MISEVRLSAIFFFFSILWLGTFLTDLEQDNDIYWQKPGCHPVGNKRLISIPGCIIFNITTGACRGYCTSYSFPSVFEKFNPSKNITSVGQCCNIMEAKTRIIRVLCLNGIRILTFKEATSCGCFHCKKD